MQIASASWRLRKTAKLSDGYRGRFQLLKVSTVPLGHGRFRYDLELGDYQPDLPAVLAQLAQRSGA